MVAGSIPVSAHNGEERVGVMKNDRKQARVNALHHALTTRLCLRAVYRLSRCVNAEIDESAYVIVLKKAGCPFEELVTKVVALIRECLEGGEDMIFANQSIAVKGTDYVIRYYIEGYKKQCDRMGFVDDGAVRVELIRRMGVSLLLRLKWMPSRLEIESYMDNADWKRQYVNEADRYVAIARHLASGAVYPISSERIDCLLQRGEGRRVEFKSCTNGAYDDTFETICSFMNGWGGDILLGVNDHGTVIGVPEDVVGATVRKIADVCNNPNRFVVWRGAVQVSSVRYRRWKLVHVHVDGGRDAFFDGERFYRKGDADFVYQYGKYKEYKANDIARARRATEERSSPIATIKDLANDGN